MLSKSIKGILIGSLIFVLTACGGGGGGGSITLNPPTNPETPIDTSFGNTATSSINAINNGLQVLNNSTGMELSAIRQIKDKDNLKTVLDSFEAIGTLKSTWDGFDAETKTALNGLFTVTFTFKEGGASKTVNMGTAINIAHGMYTRYYEGHETFWNDAVNTGQFDDTDSSYTSIKNNVETDWNKSSEDLLDEFDNGSTKNVVVNTTETVRVVVETNATRTSSTETTETETSGTVTNTYKVTTTVTTTYSSYRDDTVNYTRTDVVTTYTDGKVETTTGTTTEASRTQGTVVEHDVTTSESVSRELTETHDSSEVNINTLGNDIIQQVKIVDNGLSILRQTGNMVSAMVNIEQSDYASALAGFKQIATLKATFDSLSNADKLTLQSMTVTITYGDGMSQTTNLVDAIAIADGMYNRYYKGHETFWENGATNGQVDDSSSDFTSLSEKVTADASKSKDELIATYNGTYEEVTLVSTTNNVVNTSGTVRVVISTDATEVITSQSNSTEVTGTITRTYRDTFEVTRTYSSYRDDTVSYTRTDIVKTYSDGTTTTTTGTTTEVSRSQGNIVEHGVTDSDPVRVSHVLISTVDSAETGTVNEAHLGTKTTGLSEVPDSFLTGETRGYCGNWQGCTVDNLTVWTETDLANGTGTSYQHIDASGINDAWAKGWTGKGVNVGIIDTGVNIDHDELDGQIGGVYNNSSTDWNGHGSHVAGTIVAKHDGQGTVGVAFDSKLYVVRTPSLGYLDHNYWNYFKANDVDVVNLSINGRWDSNVSFNDSYVVGSDPNNTSNTYQSLSLIDADKNLYKWNKTVFKNGSYVNLDQVIAQDDNGNLVYGGMDSIEALASNMANSELILVNSAGNNQKIAMAPGWYATATNSDGSLMLDGRLIIVGSYDPASGTNNSHSANAGSICWDVVNDVCQDEYHVSDFFIRAPESMTSLDNSGSKYVNMNGTSMAAPVVTGSIALLRQMWPHMTGSNTVQLILQTADSSYDSYNVGLDGHGRLDMDAATQPIGAVGIPTDGRTDGATTSTNGYTAGGNSLPSSLSSLIVETTEIGFNRDWLIPLANAHVPIDTAFHSFTNYAGLTGYGNSDFAVHLKENSTDSIAVTLDGTTFGYMKEDGQYLGRYFNGMFDIGETQTAFLQTGRVWETSANNRLSANINLGYTTIDTVNGSLINNSDDLMSYGWKLQNDTVLNDKWSMSSFISQPVNVFSGNMNIHAPTSRGGNELSSNQVSYTDTEWSQTAKTETDIGIGFNYTEGDFSWGISTVSRFDTAVGNDHNVTASFKWVF